MGIAFIRTIVLYIVVIVAMRVMGKRQIGELEPSEFVVAILISELAAIPMQESGIPILNGIIPIVTLIACEIILSAISLKSVKARKWLTGQPSILIRNGVINQNEMKRLRYNIDDLMEELRLCGFMSINEVSWAVLETNGKLSVFPNSANKPVTAGMMNLAPQDAGLPVTVISDGVLFLPSLNQLGKDATWLHNKLLSLNLGPSDVFLMTIDSQGNAVIIPKEKENGGKMQ